MPLRAVWIRLPEQVNHLTEKITAIKVALTEPDPREVEKIDLRLGLDLPERALTHFRQAFTHQPSLAQQQNAGRVWAAGMELQAGRCP